MVNVNLVFWFYAYGLTLSALFIAFRGVSRARRGDVIAHGKSMNLAILLILGFVVSYLVKILVLGREEKLNWETYHFVVLYIHETFIGCMLLSGGYARYLAGKIMPTLQSDSNPSPLELGRRKRHRLAGKICLVSTSLAVITASFVLYTMVILG